MSLELVDAEVRRFLASAEPEALCITGKWGVGKTYAWREYVRKAVASNSFALKRYSYVSLFGVSSLERFRAQIFQNMLDGELSALQVSFDTVRQNWKQNIVPSLGRLTPLLRGAPFAKDYEKVITEALAFVSVRKAIVAIDDIERKGKELSVRDIFGMVSYLKEQRNCKVVIILNRDELLDPGDLSDYDNFFEKTIDVSVEFAPSAAECADIAIPDGKFPRSLLRTNCLSLNISNIRVLKKIERIVLQLLSVLSGHSDAVLKQAIHTATLFGYAKYGRGAPSINFLKEKWIQSTFGVRDDKFNDQEKLWNALLNEYNYQWSDDFDLAILAGVEIGYFDATKLRAEAAKIEEKLKAEVKEGSFSAAWDLYHGSFYDNEAEIIENMRRSFKDGVAYISPLNLNGTVLMLKDIGQNDLAAELLEFYIEARKAERQLFDLDSNPFGGEVRDPDVRAAFEKQMEKLEAEQDPIAVFYRVAAEKNWNKDDVAVMKRLSADDFYRIFKTERNPSLSRMVDAALLFGNLGPDAHPIGAAAMEALRRIGGESRLNARRVRKYIQ